MTDRPEAPAIPNRVARFLPSTDKGRAVLSGLAMLALGLFLAWPPAALIVPGAFLIALGFLVPPEPDK